MGYSVEIKQDVTKRKRVFINHKTGELLEGGVEENIFGQIGNDVGAAGGANTDNKESKGEKK